MGLIKNAINFGNGFNIGAVAPIDSRMRVELLADLTTAWTAEIPAYKGMIVSVMETSEVYVLKDADNYTSIDSWVKLGSASGAADGAADALKQAKDYTDQKVNDLATGTVQTNTNAIATLNGTVETEGSVAYAVAAEQTRAMAAEKVNADAITAEAKAREDAIKALDAEVTSTDGTHVTVKVTEVDGFITAVNVTESGIASEEALATEKQSREDADQAINNKIGTVGTGTTLVGMINAEAERATAAEGVLATKVTANENAIKILNGDDNTEGSVAYAVAAEQTRAQGEELKLNNAITAETQNRTNAINALNATAGTQDISEGKHVAVQVVETAGKLTSLVVTESDIASANELDALKAAVGTRFSSASTVADAIAAEANTRKADDDAINAKIGTVETDKTVVDMINEAKAAAIAASTVVSGDSKFITITKTGDVGKTQTYTITTQDVASETATTKAINDEVTAREQAMTAETATRLAAEAKVLDDAKEHTNTEVKKEADRAKGIEDGLNSRLTTVEGDYVKSVEAAEGSMITVSEIKQKVTLSLQWGTF